MDSHVGAANKDVAKEEELKEAKGGSRSQLFMSYQLLHQI